MAFEEWLALGGNEIINNARTVGYARTASCPMTWFKGDICGTLAAATMALENWDSTNYERAPWYDPALPEVSRRFYGAFGLEIRGIEDSTRTAGVTEGLGDGGVIGRVRKGPREVTVKALLAGEGRDSLEYGMSWLTAALDPNACGQHGDACGTADLTYFSTCPPKRAEVPVYSEWEVAEENLYENPSFETAGETIAVFENMAINPSMEAASGETVIRQNFVTNPSFEAETAATVEVARNYATNPSYRSKGAPTAQWTNLATNPSFEAETADNTEVARNSLTNPSFRSKGAETAMWQNEYPRGNFEATAGTREVRRNLFYNPGFNADINTWGAEPGVSTAWVDTGGRSSPGAMKITKLEPTHAQAGVPSPSPAVIGRSYTFSAYFKNISGDAQPYVLVGKGDGTYVGSTPLVLNDQWQRASITFIAAGTEVQLFLQGGYSTIEGSSFLADDTLFEETDILKPYFDGGTVPDGDGLWSAWTGTVNYSASVQYGQASPAAHSFDDLIGYQSGPAGDRHVKIVAVRTGYGWGMVLADGLPGNANVQYTAMFDVTLNQQMDVNFRLERAVLHPTNFHLGPLAAGTHRLRVTYIGTGLPDLPVIALGINGTKNGTEVLRVDNLLVTQGDYVGPYFDGSTPARERRNMAKNPGFDNMNGQAPASFGDGNGISYLNVGGGKDGFNSFVKEWTVAPATGTGYFDFGGVQGAGGTNFQTLLHSFQGYTGSVWFRTTHEATFSYLTVTHNVSGWQNQINGPDIVVPANTWTRLYFTGLAGGDVAGQRASIVQRSGPLPPVGAKWEISQAMVEYSLDAPGVYFDGGHGVAPWDAAWEGEAGGSASYLYDNDFTYGWVGPVNDSRSERRALAVPGNFNAAGEPSNKWYISDGGATSIVSDTSTPGGRSVQFSGLAPGRVYTALIRARNIGDNPNLTWAGATMAPLNLTSGVMEERRHTFTAGTAGTNLNLYLQNSNIPGVGFEMESFLLVEGNYTGPYFDGSTVPTDPERPYAWTGAPDASASIQYGTTIIPPFPESGPVSVIATQSSEWASAGTKSMRLTPHPDSNGDSFYALGGYNYNYFLPGHTYTVSTKLRLKAPLTGQLDAGGRALTLLAVNDAPGGFGDVRQTAPNVAGVHPLSITFTVPATGGSFCLVRLYHGGMSGAGDVWYDDLLITEGTYVGPYFDGSTPAKVRRNLLPNPSFEVNKDFLGIGPALTGTVVTPTSGVTGSKVLSCVRNLATQGNGYISAAVRKLDIGTYTFSFYMRRTVGSAPWWTAINPGDGASITGGGLVPVSLPATNGEWVRVSRTITVTVPGSIQYFVHDDGNPTPTVGETVEFDAFLFERADTALEYFDGVHAADGLDPAWEGAAHASPSYLYDDDFTYAWTGAPNASTSERRALAVPGNHQGEPSVKWYISDGGATAIVSNTSTGGGRSTFVDVPSLGVWTMLIRARKIGDNPNIRWAYDTSFGPMLNLTDEFADYYTTFTATQGTRFFLENTQRAGVGYEVAHILAIKGEYTGPYFDGSTVPASSDLVNAWTGAVDASQSVKYGSAAVGLSTVSNAGNVLSSEWASSGTKSLRVMRVNNGDSFVEFSVPVIPGKVYTAMLTTRVVEPWTSQGAPSNVSSGNWGPYADFWAWDEVLSGVQTWRITFTVPANDTTSLLRFVLRPTSDVGGSIWYDSVLLVEGTYNGPYFDGSTPAKTRQNLAPNPSQETTISFWGDMTGGQTRTVSAEQAFVGTNSQKIARDTDGYRGVAINASRPKVSAGETITASAYLWSSVPTTARAGLDWRLADGTSGNGPMANGDEVAIPAHTWTRVSVTGVAPATAPAGPIVEVEPSWGFQSGLTSADSAYLDAVLVEKSDTVGTYFDGATPLTDGFVGGWEGAPHESASYLTDADFTYAWSDTLFRLPELPEPGDPPQPDQPTPLAGVPHASKSNQLAVRPANYSFGGSAIVQSGHWSADRGKSMRIISQWEGPGSAYSDIAGTGFERGLVPGKTYTLTVQARLAGSRGGPDAPSVGIPTEDPAYSVYVAGVDVAGPQTITMMFTVPPTGWWYLRLYNNAPAGFPDVWFDALSIVEGAYDGPYFDGATVLKVRRNLYEWSRSLTTNAGGAVLELDVTVDGVTGDRYAQGTEYQPIARYRASENNLIDGETYTVSAVIKNIGSIPAQMTLDWSDGNSVAFTIPVGEERRVSTTGAIPRPYDATYNFVDIYTSVQGTEVLIRDVLIEQGTELLPHFDGAHPIAPYDAFWEGAPFASASYLYTSDIAQPVWTGTSDASTSVIGGAPVAGIPAMNNGVAVQSDLWAADRSYSLRLHPTTQSADSNVVIYGSDVDTGGLIPGHTYTVTANVRLEAPQTGPLWDAARSLKVTWSTQAGWGAQVFEMTQAPNRAGDISLRVTFTLPANTVWAMVQLYNGAAVGGGDVWWDKVLIIEGDYEPGYYFDGMSGPETDLSRYDWAGEPDASVSIHETRQLLGYDPVPIDVYMLEVAKVRRFLHDVAAVSGPLITAEYNSGRHWAYEVEYTLTAGNPYVYGMKKIIELAPRIPVIVQDVPYNLVPYPSAELSEGEVIVATNYSQNPSVEVPGNYFDWSTDGDGVQIPSAAVLGEQSNELASVGANSFKVWFAPTSAGSNGIMYAIHNVPLGRETVAGEKFSTHLWATSSAESGNPVLGALKIEVRWVATAGGYLRIDDLGPLPAGGGSISARSLVAPAGANRVQVRAVQEVVSWANGDKIRIYADAGAVMVP